MSEASAQPNASFKGRIALVTGATRGLGRALARQLGAAGAHVIAVGRTVGALEELDDAIRAAGGVSATLAPLDLKDGNAIDQLANAVAGRFEKLDIVIGNAGVLGQLSPLNHIAPKTWDEAFAVNVTANWRLIRAFHPLLANASAARAVFITSSKGAAPAAYWGAYAATKAALDALMKIYAAETAGTAIRVNAFNPGPVATAMRRQAMPGEDQATLPQPEAVAREVLPLLSPSEKRHGQIIASSFVRPSQPQDLSA